MRALIALPVIAALALAGCTAAPTPTQSPRPSKTDTQELVPGLPTNVTALSCLPDAVIAESTEQAVTSSSTDAAPPPGPVDAALAATPRVLCSYNLANGDRVGYSPLVKVVGDPAVMDAAVGAVVGYDECTQASGYLTTSQDAYYVWTGAQFAAAYILAGDPTDPEAWLAKIIDAAGLCETAAG